jgi:diguanylate cyclase (GGDEF)-like protein/PAS domain S-box-containing protein
MKQPFVSLKWKLLIPLTLAMAAGTTVLTWINDQTLSAQIARNRASSALRNQALFEFLDTQNRNQLIDAGGWLADLLALDSREAEMRATMQRYWEQLSLTQGLTGLRFYAANRQLIERFGDDPAPAAQIDAGLAVVLTRDRPVSGLYCAQRCQYYGLVPVLSAGKTVGAVAVSTDLSALLSAFGHSTGRALGVVVGTTFKLGTAADFAASLDRVKFAPQAVAAPFATALSQFDDTRYEWQRFAFPDASGAQPMLLARKDISSEARLLDRSFLNNLLTGIAVFVVAESVLLLALLWLMRRVNRVSGGLPLLGAGHWQEARQHLSLHDAQARDELGVLERATLDLADQLEALDQADVAQRAAMSTLIDTLSNERDFVGGLLDTAQVLIVTQTRSGAIRMLNRYTETLTGVPQAAQTGRDYFEQMVAEADRAACRTRISEHFARESRSLRIEARLDSPAGLRNIAWVHSLLRAQGADETLILSVGLDLTELKSAEARVSFLSEYDPLTGLYNRQAFKARLDTLLGNGEDAGSASGGALMLVDLDNFKAINDLVGHQAGDAMIRQMADRLQLLNPLPLLAARLGGDDFALYFAPQPDAQLIQTARLICQGDRSRDIATACVGLAIRANGNDTGSLLAHADLALSQARSKGHANWHLYRADDSAHQSLREHNEQLALITDGLHENRLALYLQPVIAVASGALSHYEVLLRLNTRDGRVLPPAAMIAAAELSGLIREVDQWVCRQSLRLIAGQVDLKLAVNLSARSLDNPGLPRHIADWLREAGVAASQLTLEITETAALNRIETAGAQLADIQALGCKLALDDFGVGFSTFNYLKQLPVDYVKIDGSFIRTLDVNADDRVFVRALVDAIHGYGKLAIAEFVENADILDWVRTLGIDYAQGYHYGRPEPAAQVLARQRAGIDR